MLTRIRIEAEGPTIQAVQEDIFAAHDAITNAVYWPTVIPQSDLVDEHYELTASPAPVVTPRWYKGRAILRFEGGADDPFAVRAEQVRGRTEFVKRIEDNETKAQLLAADRPMDDTSDCHHPPEAIRWNPYNEVFQCHRCGALATVETDPFDAPSASQGS